MPLVQKYIENDFEALVWAATEPTAFFVEQLALSSVEWELLVQKFKNKQALQEWLASRYLLELLCKCSYQSFQKTDKGQLYLKDSNYQVSISHSATWVMVAQSTRKIGIDIQIQNPKLKIIAPKYIAANRLELLKQKTNFEVYIHFYWGIKEALFKAYALGQVDFRKHLKIEQFDLSNTQTIAKVSKPNFEGNYTIFYQRIEKYYLCIAIEN